MYMQLFSHFITNLNLDFKHHHYYCGIFFLCIISERFMHLSPTRYMNPSSSLYKGQYTLFFLAWQEISSYQNFKNLQGIIFKYYSFESELVLIKIRTQVQVWEKQTMVVQLSKRSRHLEATLLSINNCCIGNINSDTQKSVALTLIIHLNGHQREYEGEFHRQPTDMPFVTSAFLKTIFLENLKTA